MNDYGRRLAHIRIRFSLNRNRFALGTVVDGYSRQSVKMEDITHMRVVTEICI